APAFRRRENVSGAGSRYANARRRAEAADRDLAQRRPRPRPPRQAREEAGGQQLAADRAERGQEPRNSPYAGPPRAQGASPQAHRHRTDPDRRAAGRQGPPPDATRALRPAASQPPPRPPGASPRMTALTHCYATVTANTSLARDTFCLRLYVPPVA